MNKFTPNQMISSFCRLNKICTGCRSVFIHGSKLFQCVKCRETGKRIARNFPKSIYSCTRCRNKKEDPYDGFKVCLRCRESLKQERRKQKNEKTQNV